MPDVRNCKRCGKVYNYIGGSPICQACRDQDEVDFRKIKDYLYQYPGASLSEVATTLNVAVEKIKKFLRDGRLEIINSEGNLVLDCEKCGKAINSGRFCKECEREVAADLKNISKEMGKAANIDEGNLSREQFIKYLTK